MGIAFDGRIGHGWFPAPFLNRTALLSTGLGLHVRLVPWWSVFCHTPTNEPPQSMWVPPFLPANHGVIWPKAWVIQESWLTRTPHGIWMLHTRDRAGITIIHCSRQRLTTDGDDETQLR